VTRDDRLIGRRPIICLVTDRRRLAPWADPGDLEPLVAHVKAAVRAGVDLVQVRERDLEAAQLAALTSACLDAARGSELRVLVNDRLDVALAVGAHGVHLRSDSMPPERVRAVAPEGFLIGRSVHAEQEALDVASTMAVDYMVFGTVFPTRSKPFGHPTTGLDALDQVARSVAVPVLGIGGLDADGVARLARTAASGFAAIGYFSVARHGGREASDGPLAYAVRHARQCYAATALTASMGTS
jgi:thiamine-phosphate pyrophosphorylase